MVPTKSQKHWRAWLSALQTRDANLRAAALEQLSKFLDYWTAELYVPTPFRGLVNGGRDTPQPESWDEVFNVDTDSLIRPKRLTPLRFGSEEAYVCYLDLLCAKTGRLDHMDWTNTPLNQIGLKSPSSWILGMTIMARRRQERHYHSIFAGFNDLWWIAHLPMFEEHVESSWIKQRYPIYPLH